MTEFYSAPGPMTEMDRIGESIFAGLPTEGDQLCAVSPGLVVHEFLAGAYGVADVGGREEELEARTVYQMVAAITALDPSPLAAVRPPAQRMVGNCRHHAVLTCALLRRAGFPARVRAGFSGYFGEGWVDHWLVERWMEGRWVRTDSQLDDTQREIFGIGFDPLDVPPTAFLTGSEAWRRCRDGDDDPQRFGIEDMRGLWFIAANAVRDLAALNKVEVHVWDVWGTMEEWPFTELSPDQIAFVDHLTKVVLSDDLASVRDLYRQDGLRVPGEVHSHRFGRPVEIPA